MDVTNIIRPPEWHTEALCAEVDPELFFPEPDRSADAVTAVNLCRTCPVLQPCHDSSLHELYGVWGGRTPPQRKRERMRVLARIGMNKNEELPADWRERLAAALLAEERESRLAA